jgi:hypothetical protein
MREDGRVHDREHNAGRALRPWKRFHHPQLGELEVGGLDPREGISNPPRELMPETCARHTRMTLMLASLAPRLHVEAHAERLGAGVHRVRVTVENRGYLSTHILDSARDLPRAEEVHLHLEARGCTLDGAPLRAVATWKGGAAGRATAGTRDVLVHGHGTLVIRAQCARAGRVMCSVELPQA